MRVIHHPHAEAELIEAAQYYERSVAALVRDFWMKCKRLYRSFERLHSGGALWKQMCGST